MDFAPRLIVAFLTFTCNVCLVSVAVENILSVENDVSSRCVNFPVSRVSGEQASLPLEQFAKVAIVLGFKACGNSDAGLVDCHT